MKPRELEVKFDGKYLPFRKSCSYCQSCDRNAGLHVAPHLWQWRNTDLRCPSPVNQKHFLSFTRACIFLAGFCRRLFCRLERWHRPRPLSSLRMQYSNRRCNRCLNSVPPSSIGSSSYAKQKDFPRKNSLPVVVWHNPWLPELSVRKAPPQSQPL